MEPVASIRTATDADRDSLYSIYSAPSVAPNMGFDPCSRAAFDDIVCELESTGELLVLENHSKSIDAVCKISRRGHRLRHSAYIGSLAIHPEKQSQGVGRHFFKTITDQLKQEGYTRLELLVAADNLRAISFFQSFGFEIEGTLKQYFSRSGYDELFDEHIMAWVAMEK
ncbi:GNAT family N-acetyltransferase [Endozoicomonas arenosclerae]|uniref:GNAT family N-acetyltransferase n=1 Tax=Endozoicomonas arenosclerae TaxID=1633495 RepID=UPI000780F4C9|nr:GNAT family N-acetyltransferase [Endozoicomonas arenosclerae]